MILYKPTHLEECTLRREYVSSERFLYRHREGYRSYTISTVPGVMEVGYVEDTDPHTLDTLIFDTEENLTWFKLRYS